LNFFAVAKGNMYTLADPVRVFTLKGESVGQEGFYTRIGHGRRPPLSRIEYIFALFWFFPTEVDYRRRSRAPTRHFFANNVMFRATVFRRAMFPDAPLVLDAALCLPIKW
jgi:hypothetical protein